MARKTDGEKIDELVTLVATLTERVNALHRVVEPMQELITRVALVEQQTSDFQNRIAKAADRGLVAGTHSHRRNPWRGDRFDGSNHHQALLALIA